MSKTSQPTILIIIGVTGDLSRRYLLPAIQALADAGELPKDFRILGVTRQAMKVSDFLQHVEGDHAYFKTNLELCTSVNLADKADYHLIDEHVKSIEAKFGGPAQRLFYLSIPPQVSQSVVELLGASDVGKAPNTKLLLEKPFGTDLGSAEELIANTEQYFEEDQIYRIDHYLAKEMTQNMLILREANPLLKRTWNCDFIESIEILAAESIDIEGRANFYEQTGALRDVMQSHVLQLAALTLMDDASEHLQTVPARRYEALRLLHIPRDDSIRHYVKRGQYDGYRQEVDNPKSNVETFVSIDAVSDDPRWKGVPIRLITGKALKQKQTSIRITYKSDAGYEPNQLLMHIQPDEGTELKLWAKTPGYEHRLHQHPLRFAYREHFSKLPDAYEQVILDAIHSNHSLFAGSGEIKESWRILEPVLRAWSMSNDDIISYKKGSDPLEILSSVAEH